MKKITFTLLASIITISSALAQNTDSLQRRDDSIQHICAQADRYTNLADSLIQYNQPKTRMISIADATQASNYVLKAIQIYKRSDDILTIRNSFDRLGEAYVMQNKFTQAKWYILQANTISRDQHDVPRIIAGLIKLADVKVSIKDYALAEKDLQEAIVLTKYSYNVPAQIEVEKKLAQVYDKTDKVKEAKSTMAHYTLLAENLNKPKVQPILAMQKPKVKAIKKPTALTAKQTITIGEEQTGDMTVTDVTANVVAQNN